MEQWSNDDALDALSLTDDCVKPVDLRVERERELRFFDAHPDLERQLIGQWVALDGDELISHGLDLEGVLQRADDAGHPDPFIMRVLDPAITYVL